MTAGERVRILAVDDTPANLTAMSAVLVDLGEEVQTASSGREALRLLLRHEFAVVLLDVHMPGMDGFETASLLRQRQSSEHTPIIFVTSYPDESYAARGYSLGAVDYILAPPDPEILKAKVGVFVELFRKTAQTRAQAAALERRAVQLQRLTKASLAINSALSPGEMLQVVADFGRDIIGVHQAVAVAVPDQKWHAARSAVALSPRNAPDGEAAILRDWEALVALLSETAGPVRRPDGEGADDTRYFADDRARRLGWLAAPLTGRDGRPIGLLHLLDKVDGAFDGDDEVVLTQLAQLSSIAIENAINAEAREANRMKDEFLTTLSHELRTPLAAILGWTRLLRSDGLDPERKGVALEIIERNVLVQTKLIDDMLDVSRIITGKLGLAIRPTGLAAVVRAAMDSMRPAADGKQIDMRFQNRVPAEADQMLGDPDRLQQIIWNLVSNSIKFTPPQGRVSITLARHDREFEIEVCDTGQGMSPEFLAHAFDRFRQADSSTTRSQGGLGIGLAIARHLTELHGGSIEAESAGPGEGSRFRVLLPVVALGIESDAKWERETVASPLERKVRPLGSVRVLLVEDQWDTRDLMAVILRSAGCEVVAAGSVPEAIEALEGFRPDVLVSDIGMPGEDGYALLRRIRQRPEPWARQLPALAVSAYAREEDRIRSLAVGFQMHITKPFEPLDLTTAVGHLVRRAPEEAESGVGAASGSDGPPSVLVVEDDADLRHGLRQLLEASGYQVEVAENGLEGVERAIDHRPRIAFIDLGLPRLDGFGVAERIRKFLPRSQITLVALTGRTSPDDLHRIVASGFDDYIAKPFSFDKVDHLLATKLAGPPRPSSEEPAR
jgi:CheY-like chemotaxis protein